MQKRWLIEMLQASLANGTLVTPAQLTETKIESYRSCKFYCPTCQAPVILKAGERVIPHFAHKSNSPCIKNKGGESKEHYEGKLLLYNWLKTEGLQVKLEKYIPTLDQQPDLLIPFENKQIAIEYQCSPVSAQSIRKRTSGYLKENIQPIWILSPRLLQRITPMKIRVTSFLKQFIHQFSPNKPQNIYFLCPTTKQLSIFQHIYFTNNTVAYGVVKFVPLRKLHFLNLFQNFPLDQERLYKNWLFEKQYLRTKATRSLYGQQLLWNQWIYTQGLYVQYLPSVIHLPIASQVYMKSPPWDWQSRIYLNLIHPKNIGSSLNLRQCVRLLRRHIQKEDYFPLIKQSANAAIKEYLNILCTLNILERNGEHNFIIKNKSKTHDHLETALEADQQLINYIQQKTK